MSHAPEPSFPRSDLARLFCDDERFTTRLGPGVSVCRTVGQVSLPSGRLVAQDPFMNGEAAFDEAVPVGHAAVHVAAIWLDGGSERVASAMVAFRDDATELARRKAVKWQLARRTGSEQADPFRFGVDYATAAFMDEKAARWLSTNDPGRTSIAAALEMAGRGSSIALGASAGNLVAFSSGAGDGSYASWWGVDDDGQRVCLVIDFELTTDEHEAPLAPDASLFTAVKRRDANAVRASRAKKTELGCETTHGVAPLHWAAHAGLADVVRALLERGAKPDLGLAGPESLWRRYTKGATALLVAADRGALEVVRALLEAGASPKAASNEGVTPLHVAARAGHASVCAALLEAGADAGAVTRGELWQERFVLLHPRGTTALHLATAAGHADVVAALLRDGNAIDAQDHDGLTALHFAAQLQRTSIAELLLRAGAEAGLVAKDGRTAIWAATWAAPDDEASVVRLVRALAAAGGMRNEVVSGNTALHRAAGQGAVEVIRALLEIGFDLDDARGRGSVLSWAAAEGHLEAVKVLVEAGAKVDARGKNSAREKALRYGRRAVVRYLDEVIERQASR